MACKLFFVASLAASLVVGLHSVELLSVAPPKDCTGTLAYQPADNATAEIVIPAFFPFPSDKGGSQGRELANGHYLIPAAVLALDEINSRSGLLPGYHLRLDIRDSSCDKYKSVYELILSAQNAQDGTAPQVAVLGGGCSLASAGLGLLAPRYQLAQVSYGNNPSSTDRSGNVLPFFQTVETFDQTLRTALEVLQHFSWTNNIAFVSQDNEVYTRVLETVVSSTFDGNFTASTENTSINIVVLHEVHSDVNPVINFATFLKDVRDEKVRVIVAAVNENYAHLLLCKAKSGQMPGSGFVWVFIGSFSERWWERNGTCVIDAEDVESVLIVSSETRNPNASEVMDTSGKTITAFETEYKERLQQWCPGAKAEPLATTTYDALWAIALAVNQTMDSIGTVERHVHNTSVLHREITNSLSETNFLGASGRVQFNGNRGRVGVDAIYQMQGGVQQLVGHYDDGQLKFKSETFPLVWPDGSPPSDVPEEIQESVPLWFIGPAVVITLLGVAFSAAMLVFNCVYSKHRILLAASQRLNYIILVGTWMGFFSVLVLCLLESEIGIKISGELFASLCVIRLTALSTAFTLAYGTMFARAWRIYRIFNDPWASNRPLRDYHLMLMVGLLLIGDLVILITWTSIDTYQRSTSISDIDYETYSRCTYVACGSTHLFIWLSIVGVYKLLLMLGGVFVVSLVRKAVVERKIFDDSRSLSLALYVTAISFSVGLPLQFLFLLQFQIVFAFIAGAVWVNVSSYSTIICVFLPKFYAIVIKKDSGKKLRSVKSVFYVAHPELRHSPDYSNSRASPEYTNATDFASESYPITDGINFGTIRALPDSVAKSVSFEDTVDYIT